MAYSILIKNGMVLDGTGGEPYRADVGIAENRIKDIGENLGNSAEKIIDAAKCYVAPGFIDVTNHADVYGTLFFAPTQESMLMQGITTVLIGNCGESLAPLLKKDALNDLEKWTSGFSVPVDWRAITEFHETLKKINIGVNVATLIGHETLKRNAANPDDMPALLEVSLKDGAWGFSSNFNFAEWTPELEEETTRLLSVVKKHNALYKIHLRDEGKYFLPSVASFLKLVRLSGVRALISHFKAVGRQAWKEFPNALRMIQNAQDDGLDVSFDFFPYLRTGSMLISLLPVWAKSGTTDEILLRLSDRKEAARVVEELGKSTLHPEKILVASAPSEKAFVGKSLKEIAERAGLSAEQAILEILKLNRLNVTIFGRTISGRNLLRAAAFQNSIVSTDGAGYNLDFMRWGDLAHPRSFGALPRFLNLISKKSTLKLSEAIKKITSLPARAIGLESRGVIAKNKIADITIFDPFLQDKASYLHPYVYADGIKFVIVSGFLAVEDEKISLKQNGRVLIKKQTRI